MSRSGAEKRDYTTIETSAGGTGRLQGIATPSQVGTHDKSLSGSLGF